MIICNHCVSKHPQPVQLWQLNRADVSQPCDVCAGLATTCLHYLTAGTQSQPGKWNGKLETADCVAAVKRARSQMATREAMGDFPSKPRNKPATRLTFRAGSENHRKWHIAEEQISNADISLVQEQGGWQTSPLSPNQVQIATEICQLHNIPYQITVE